MTPTASPQASGSTHVPVWVVLLIAGAALVVSTAALAVSLVATPSARPAGWMMGGGGTGTGASGMMGGGYGMMSGGGMMGGQRNGAGSQPGAAGFVAGTAAAPRTIRLTAGPGLAFYPSATSVVQGETVTFVVTTMGPTAHEFMVGPAAAVAVDTEGTPEIADIGMMATKSLTYTFDGSGPYAFACHATGHYEAGMRGTIEVLPA